MNKVSSSKAYFFMWSGASHVIALTWSSHRLAFETACGSQIDFIENYLMAVLKEKIRKVCLKVFSCAYKYPAQLTFIGNANKWLATFFIILTIRYPLLFLWLAVVTKGKCFIFIIWCFVYLAKIKAFWIYIYENLWKKCRWRIWVHY